MKAECAIYRPQFCETWLGPEINDDEILIDNYGLTGTDVEVHGIALYICSIESPIHRFFCCCFFLGGGGGTPLQ